MGFVKSESFLLVLSVSDQTLQSIPGVNSVIYCVDENPTPYSAPLMVVKKVIIVVYDKNGLSQLTFEQRKLVM